ncbi:hypothetical protein ACLOJK_032124 [Asimina triloba]
MVALSLLRSCIVSIGTCFEVGYTGPINLYGGRFLTDVVRKSALLQSVLKYEP